MGHICPSIRQRVKVGFQFCEDSLAENKYVNAFLQGRDYYCTYGSYLDRLCY